jgi:uncharacterized protein YkwD
VGALAAGRSPGVQAPCAGAGLHPTSANTQAIDAATLCLVDQVRAAHRLTPLRQNRELGEVASSEVTAMVRWNYFADVGPSGQTPLSLAVVTHYPAHAASVSIAQDIAWGDGDDTTPACIVAAWMDSPPHRQIILDGEYRDAGVAATASLPSVVGVGRDGATYAMEFGARRNQ